MAAPRVPEVDGRATTLGEGIPATRPGETAAYNPRTCQPSRGDRSRPDPGTAAACCVARSDLAPSATRDPDLAVRLQMKLGVISEPDRASDCIACRFAFDHHDLRKKD